AILFSITGTRLSERFPFVAWARCIVNRKLLTLSAIGCIVLMGCFAIAVALYEPVPRIHDEFSYLLMAETFASGQVVNPSPPLSQFFDTFHELMRSEEHTSE